MRLAAALEQVRRAPFVVDVLRAAEHLSRTAESDAGPDAVELLSTAAHGTDDQLTAVAAIHALGQVFDDDADDVLTRLLSHADAFRREHAAWVLGARLPRLDAVRHLVDVVAAGGFSGVLAQRTLEQWAVSSGDHVAPALTDSLRRTTDSAARGRLVETLGLVPGAGVARALRDVASGEAEAPAVRAAAVAALGDRDEDPESTALLTALATGDDGLFGDGEIAAAAELALGDIGRSARLPRPRQEAGFCAAQLFLHADIDRGLTRAGAGDNGGIATLLLGLGDALVTDPRVTRVLTLSRGTARGAVATLGATAEPHLLVPVPLPHPPPPAAQAWPSRVAAERGIRRALTAHGPVDVLHLRMADVGSLAAADVAALLDVPVVFTLAPDPHAVLHALDMTGALTRRNFGDVDAVEHYWFRARLVERLAASAAHTVLFPRPQLRDDLRELLDIDVDADTSRCTVVPEGIDLTLTDAARAAAGAEHDPAVAALEALVAGLPAHRHGLPLALSVGRLHRVKGPATVVQAWASDPALRERCNLVVVGGDLERPSPDERDQLERIAAVVAEHPGAADGLVVAGHRPHQVVAHWMAAAHVGRPPLVAPDGVYVCGSLKEEFGLALLEALAAGLPVVGPSAGGPATYVRDGVTGFGVDTRDPRAVGRGMVDALDLAARDRRARVRCAYATVRDRYTVQAMATALAEVYERARRGVGQDQLSDHP